MGLKNVKVVFCGPRGFGKTSLIEQMFYDKAPFADPPNSQPMEENPNVIQLNPYHHMYQHIRNNDDDITLNIWEYGARFYRKNKFPLRFTETTLYIYVWDYDSDDINGEIEFFRDNYSRLSGSSSKVLFVLIHINGSDGNYNAFKRILEKITPDKRILDNIFYVGREKDNQTGDLLDRYSNTDKLKKQILMFAEDKAQGIIRLAERIPHLIDMVNATQNLMHGGSYYINKDNFLEICVENYITNEADKQTAFKFLERNGLMHCFSPKKSKGASDIVVLNPTMLVADFDEIAESLKVNNPKFSVEDIEEDFFNKIFFNNSASLKYRYFKNYEFSDAERNQWISILTGEPCGCMKPKRIEVEHYQIHYENKSDDLFERLIDDLLSLVSAPANIYNRYRDVPQVAFIGYKFRKKDYYICKGEAGFFCGSAALRIRFSIKTIFIEIYAETAEYPLFRDLTGILFSFEKKLRDELNLKMQYISVHCTNVYSWQESCEYLKKEYLALNRCYWKYTGENLFCANKNCMCCLDGTLGIHKLCRGLENYEAYTIGEEVTNNV